MRIHRTREVITMTDTDLADWLRSARVLTQAEVDQRTAERRRYDLTAEERREGIAAGGWGR